MALTGLVSGDYAAYVVFNGNEIANGKVPVGRLKEAPPGELLAVHKVCVTSTVATLRGKLRKRLPNFDNSQPLREIFDWINPSWLTEAQRVCAGCGERIKLSGEEEPEVTLTQTELRAVIQASAETAVTQDAAAEVTRSVEVVVFLPPNFLADILSTAIEGGVDHWADVVEYRLSESTSGERRQLPPEGITAKIRDREDGKVYDVTIDTIAEGIRRLLADNVKIHIPIPASIRSIKRDLAEVLAGESIPGGNIDAGDADNIVQAALLGEIVY